MWRGYTARWGIGIGIGRIRSLRRWMQGIALAGGTLTLVQCASTADGPGGGGSSLAPAALLATIPVGRGPTYLAQAPDGSRVYAASDGTLSVIETAGNTVMAKLPVGANPTGIAVTPDGAHLLLTNLFSVRVTVLQTATNTFSPPIDLFGERFTGGFGRIAVLPDSTVAWVANQDNEVLAIVRTDGSAVHSRDIDMRPVDIAFSPDGRSAYVAGCRQQCVPGTVEIISTPQRLTEGYINVGPSPYRIMMAPDGAHFYTTNLGDASLSVVDVATRSTVASVHIGVEPTGLAVARDGSMIYVSSQDLGTVTAVDAATYTVRNTLRVGDQARDVVVTPDGRRLYVSTRDAVLAIEAGAVTGGS
jgi:YVTN family beta-propeller protein